MNLDLLLPGSAGDLIDRVALPPVLHAAPVSRAFLDEAGETCYRDVLGSVFEFIQRNLLPGENRLDLAFDTGNAQGIFKMTAA